MITHLLVVRHVCVRCHCDVCFQLMTEDDIEEDEEAVASDPTLSTQVRYIPEDASTRAYPPPHHGMLSR